MADETLTEADASTEATSQPADQTRLSSDDTEGAIGLAMLENLRAKPPKEESREDDWAPEEELLGPESSQEPESPERIQATKDVLAKLVELAKEHAHNFRRDIETTEFVFVPNAIDPQNRRLGAMVEQRVKVKTGNEDLKTIDLHTFASQDGKRRYEMSVSFLPESGEQLMLSGVWPLDLHPIHDMMTIGNAAKAGLGLQGRRIQDFLYKDGQQDLPVREADFTYGFNYRPHGPERNSVATRAQMDVILQILAHAHVVKDGQPVARVADLVPEVHQLIQ